MKRNKLFGAAALLVAGAAIGAGASITQSVMADSEGGGTADSVTMVNIGTDGTAISCTFTGADAAGLVPALPAVATSTGAVGETGVVTVSGPTQVVGQGTDQPVTIQVGSVTAGAPVPASGEGTIVGNVSTGGSIIGMATVDGNVVGSDVRDGTPEECAAMRADGLVAVANAVPTDDAAKAEANGIKP